MTEPLPQATRFRLLVNRPPPDLVRLGLGRALPSHRPPLKEVRAAAAYEAAAVERAALAANSP